ncbi:MAG: hypothetical protein IIU35_05280 [Neisseriaceae bacterium]|nr:hypothetical protein [Neisseriaceae bacterium]
MAATLKMVTAQIPESVFWELETYAKELDRSKSWLVRQAIVDMLASRKKTQQQNNESEWDELFDFIRQANESGEDMNIELPPRENVWKPNPILETDWGDMADDAKN